MRKGAVAITVMLLASTAQVAWAHEASTFRACTVQAPGSCLTRGASFLYGDTVAIRGKVEPAHAGVVAKVLRRDPGSNTWTTLAERTVSERGRLRFAWETDKDDAVQDAPYLFRFKIPGHGSSNGTEVYVLYGE
ncbi:MAG TPA: hypothetical protein VFK59_00715 [Actinomycetota bacterium]|nr:hypothetical protein [Actinomycetota bacterium]